MAMQKIKTGGFVSDEISKINSNFDEVEADYAKKSELPTIPTKVSELTNDSGYVTSDAVPTKTSDLTNDSNYVDQTQLNNAVNGITVPTKVSDLTNDAGYITADDIPEVTVPTKTSDLTNDSGFVTDTQVANSYVEKETGKGLSTEDYTTAEKNKLADLSAPENKTFTTANWTANGNQYACTIAVGNKKPVLVMRKDGSNYRASLIDIAVSGTNAILTSDETFEGYIVCV